MVKVLMAPGSSGPQALLTSKLVIARVQTELQKMIPDVQISDNIGGGSCDTGPLVMPHKLPDSGPGCAMTT